MPLAPTPTTQIRPCSCGKPRAKAWHLACPVCWSHIPQTQQDEVYHLYKTARGTPDHIAAVRRCYAVIHTARAAN